MKRSASKSLALVSARKEQIARERGHAGDDGIRYDDRAALRDLDALVHVDARVLAADDILRRRKEPPDAEQRERERDARRQSRAARLGPEPQIEARGGGQRASDQQVGDQQPLEAVAVQRSQREHQRRATLAALRTTAQ